MVILYKLCQSGGNQGFYAMTVLGGLHRICQSIVIVAEHGISSVANRQCSQRLKIEVSGKLQRRKLTSDSSRGSIFPGKLCSNVGYDLY